MNLSAQIEQDLIAALKEKDDLKRDTLRLLKSALKNFQIEKGSELTDEEVLKIIQKETKKRLEAIELYGQANRPELAEKEKAEMDILKEYLPDLMPEEEVHKFIDDYLTKFPELKEQQKGRVIGQLVGELKGKADPTVIAKYVSTIIS